MLERHLGEATGIACALSDADRGKVVARTAGYSGSDMRALIQEACQVGSSGPPCLVPRLDMFRTDIYAGVTLSQGRALLHRWMWGCYDRIVVWIRSPSADAAQHRSSIADSLSAGRTASASSNKILCW